MIVNPESMFDTNDHQFFPEHQMITISFSEQPNQLLFLS